MIPEPPHGPLPDPAALVDHVVAGICGACCMCARISVTWLDLIAAGLEPVIDNSGALTDHACLHGRCVVTLHDHWVSLGVHGGPGESTRSLDDDDAPEHDDTVDEADILAGPAAPTSSLPPLGVYAT